MVMVMVMMMYTGMHCTECGYNCHEKCVPHVPKNCTKLRPSSHLTSLATDRSANSVTAAESGTLVATTTQSTTSAAAGRWWFAVCYFMPVTHLPEVCTKTGTKKPVPVSDVSDVQFGTEYFWYQFLVSNGTCCILMPFMVPAFWYEFYGTSFLVWVFGADFWYVSWVFCSRLQGKPHCSSLHLVFPV